MASFSATKASNFTLFASSSSSLWLLFMFPAISLKLEVKEDGLNPMVVSSKLTMNGQNRTDFILETPLYKNDSVLLVEGDDYENCQVKNPKSKFEDGNTVFKFDHSGFFYFISGKPGHCQAGQKMIIRVMVQSAAHQPTASAPAPFVDSVEGPSGAPAGGPSGAPDGGDGMISDSMGPPATNATDMLSVTSCFLTLFIGVMVVLYLFMD
ncbi:Early nodulin-like protein 1 [Bienertia sinuspersici]